MPVIRIDDDVMRELQSHAVSMRLVFGQPNQVLRRVLGLDENPEQAATRTGLPQPPTTGVQQVSPARRVSGKSLLREHEDLPQGMRPYTDRDGVFYEWPRGFPAVLFDRGGYLIFPSEQAMLNAQGPRLYPDTHKISVPDGISSIPKYVGCEHDHYEPIPTVSD